MLSVSVSYWLLLGRKSRVQKLNVRKQNYQPFICQDFFYVCQINWGDRGPATTAQNYYRQAVSSTTYTSSNGSDIKVSRRMFNNSTAPVLWVKTLKTLT